MLAAKHGTGDVLFWCLVLIGVVGVMGFGVWLIRRRLFATPNSAVADEWSLQQLRELKQRGEISDEEFERLRSMIIAQYQQARSRGAENARDPSSEIGDPSPPFTGENGGID